MELIRLKKQLKFAYRGHKLLKDKQEGLMRYFLKLFQETKSLRQDVEKKLNEVYKPYLSARANLPKETVEFAVSAFPHIKLDIQKEQNMSLRLPRFNIEEIHLKHSPHTDIGLNLALSLFSEVFSSLIKLSEKEKAMELTAFELQRTRRRVNALEYILIPSLKETIKFISNRLNELERENITRLMKIKELVLR
jgi:V/A-type H+-transporting ATPase subunit D